MQVVFKKLESRETFRNKSLVMAKIVSSVETFCLGVESSCGDCIDYWSHYIAVIYNEFPTSGHASNINLLMTECDP